MIIKYPDGSSYAVTEKNYNFVHRINSYEDLWHLNQIVDAYNSIGIRPNMTIPCLLDAQADQRFHKGESFGLKLVLDFLYRMDADFTFFHPHNPDLVRFALPNCTVRDNSEFVKICLLENGVYDRVVMGMRADISNTILMSPDAGAYKTLFKVANNISWQGETFSASKSRYWDLDTKESRLTQIVDRQDFLGKDVFIVDDLCIYGGTFKGLSKILRTRNVGKLNLIVSHMTVPDLGSDPVTDYFDNVYTTDSKYGFYTTKNETVVPSNLHIIKLFS